MPTAEEVIETRVNVRKWYIEFLKKNTRELN